MKTLFTTLLLSVLFTSSYSQTYRSIFGDSATTWNVYKEGIDFGTTVAMSYTADSVIEGMTYKYFISGQSYCMKSFLLREDSSHAKLFYRLNANSAEYLIMNLNQQVGDTIYNSASNWYCGDNTEPFFIIDTIFIDTTGLLTPFPAKHVVTSNYLSQWPFGGDIKIEYIEGVGPVQGPAYPDFDGLLLCQTKDSIQTYTNSYDCYYSWLGLNKVDKEIKVSVLPNPATDEIYLQLQNKTNLPLPFSIINILGAEIKSGTITSPNQKMEIADIPAGLYIIKVGNHIYGRFIKN